LYVMAYLFQCTNIDCEDQRSRRRTFFEGTNCPNCGRLRPDLAARRTSATIQITDPEHMFTTRHNGVPFHNGINESIPSGTWKEVHDKARRKGLTVHRDSDYSKLRGERITHA